MIKSLGFCVCRRVLKSQFHHLPDVRLIRKGIKNEGTNRGTLRVCEVSQRKGLERRDFMGVRRNKGTKEKQCLRLKV